MKSVQIRSFFWSVFSCIRTEYEDLRRKSRLSVRIQENMNQKKLRIWTLFMQGVSWQICQAPVNKASRNLVILCARSMHRI